MTTDRDNRVILVTLAVKVDNQSSQTSPNNRFFLLPWHYKQVDPTPLHPLPSRDAKYYHDSTTSYNSRWILEGQKHQVSNKPYQW